jgi:hypothetical protein
VIVEDDYNDYEAVLFDTYRYSSVSSENKGAGLKTYEVYKDVV